MSRRGQTGAPRGASQRDQDPVHCIHGSLPTQGHQVCPHVAWREPSQPLVVKVFRQLQLSTQCFQDPERGTKVPFECLSVHEGQVYQGDGENVLVHKLLQEVKVLEWISTHVLTLASLKLLQKKRYYQQGKAKNLRFYPHYLQRGLLSNT